MIFTTGWLLFSGGSLAPKRVRLIPFAGSKQTHSDLHFQSRGSYVV
jgi:hypothetical protein